MLNCSTCHKKKPVEHFYRYPDHRAHIPMNASPEDGEALARLLADGLVSSAAAYQTPTHARAALASARERLATSGRPVESEAQRRARELAQRQAQEEADYYAAHADDADGEGDAPGWVFWAWLGGIGAVCVGGVIWARHALAY